MYEEIQSLYDWQGHQEALQRVQAKLGNRFDKLSHKKQREAVEIEYLAKLLADIILNQMD